jgi:ribosomal protein L15
LNDFEENTVVNNEALVKAGLMNAKDIKKTAKVILNGEITKKLTVAIKVTAGVKKAIEQVGGSVQEI